MTTELKIEGMMCGHCEAHMVKALMAIDGVTNATASHTDKKAVVTSDREISMDEFEAAVKEAGYELIK